MPLEPGAINTLGAVITRPDRSGPGGDIVGTPPTIATVDALREPRNDLLRRDDGVELLITARFYFSVPKTVAGAVIEIVPGDLIAWSNYAGVAVDEQEIFSLEPIFDCDQVVDQLVATVGRPGA